MRRKSGVMAALGLIAMSAGIGTSAANEASAALEKQYQDFSQFESPEAMQQELSRLMSTDFNDPAIPVVLEQMVAAVIPLVPAGSDATPY